MMLASEIFELANNVTGAFSNLLLMYLIRRFSRKELGTYKHLLFAFASFDVFLCALHAFVEPKIITVGPVFSAAGHSFIESRYISAMFTSSFTVPFSLMNIHFLYRFISIRFPTKILLFSDKRIVALLFFYPSLQVLIWFSLSIFLTPVYDFEALEIVRAEMKREYNLTKDGHFRFEPTLILSIAFVVIAFNFTTATSLGSLTYYYINKTKEISFSFKSFQRSILIAVFAQTSVPVIFVYIPYVCVLYFPFFGLPPLYMPQLFPILLSIFPEWDAFVIILLIRDYRHGLAQLLGMKKTTVGESTVWMTSSSNIPSSVHSTTVVQSIASH